VEYLPIGFITMRFIINVITFSVNVIRVEKVRMITALSDTANRAKTIFSNAGQALTVIAPSRQITFI